MGSSSARVRLESNDDLSQYLVLVLSVYAPLACLYVPLYENLLIVFVNILGLSIIV